MACDMSSEILFSIIIATYNRYNLLWRLLNSIDSQKGSVSTEILVIDQSEHYVAHKIRLEACGIRYFHTSQRGLSRARNIGISHAKGRYIILMDDDAVMESSLLQKAIGLQQREHGYAGLCGIIRNIEDGEPFSRYMDEVQEELSLKNFNKAMSSAMILNRNAVITVGGFDERFGIGSRFGGSEETDLLLRLFWRGYRILYSPEIEVFHPRYDECVLPLRTLFSKSFSYGMGRGALIRKYATLHPRWFLLNSLFEIILKPLGGALLSGIRMDLRGCFRHAVSCCGRLNGFRTYSDKNIS